MQPVEREALLAFITSAYQLPFWIEKSLQSQDASFGTKNICKCFVFLMSFTSFRRRTTCGDVTVSYLLMGFQFSVCDTRCEVSSRGSIMLTYDRIEEKNTNGAIGMRNTRSTQYLPEKIMWTFYSDTSQIPKNIRGLLLIEWSPSVGLEDNKINQTSYEKPWFVVNFAVYLSHTTIGTKHHVKNYTNIFMSTKGRISYDISLAYFGLNWGLRHLWKAVL